MNDEPPRIRITLDDLSSVHVPAPATAPESGSTPGGPKNYGKLTGGAGSSASVPTERGPLYLQAWFYLGLAGLAGAFIAWAICEPGFADGDSARWGNVVIFPLMVILMSVGFGTAESMVERSLLKVGLRGLLSLAAGIPLGFLFYFLANIVFTVGLHIIGSMGVESASNPVLWLVRALAWVVFGAVGGLVYGIVGQSGKKCLYGVCGGILGAGLGGLAFDPIALLLGKAALSRAFGMTVFGVTTGVAMGLVESALKNRWLHVTAGPLAGKQFILYKPQTTLGSQQGADIYLFKDPSILPSHATLMLRGHQLWLQANGEVLINGQRAGAQALRHGDLVQVGRYSFHYQEKKP